MVIVVCMIISSCKNDEEELSYRYCDTLLSSCFGSGSGEFCTFGFKWGNNTTFPNAGLEKSGPATSGGTISFSFQDEGITFNTHSQTNVVSLSFDLITVCDTKAQIIRALQAWESVADITFVEAYTANQSDSDIKFIVADIQQGGIGYPPYQDDLCSTIAGQVIFDIPTRNTCDKFYNLVLHEVGHVLGLGHVSSFNIMNPDLPENIIELQSGDIRGIQSIYGRK